VPEFATYARNVVENARALGEGLTRHGHVLVTGCTDNHILLWDVRWSGGGGSGGGMMMGSKVERVLQLARMTADKNSIPGDTSVINPGRVRLRTPALTARRLDARDFDAVAEFLHRGYDLVAARREKEKGGLTGSGDIGGAGKI